MNASDIDPLLLTDVVRRCLNQPQADLGPWVIEPVNYPNMNPQYRALYRLHGDVNRQPWSVILKVISRPEGQSGDDPAAPFYWKREGLIFQSGLLETLPQAFRAPRCFGVTQPSETTFWLWLEDIRDSAGAAWTPALLQTAAHNLGLFSGAFSLPERLPGFPWLSRQLIRAWVGDFSGLISELRQVNGGGHAQLRATLSPEVVASTLRVWDAREKLFAALDELPQTLCHHDVWCRNLFAIHDGDDAGYTGAGDTVAIDWEAAGLGAIGEDLGNLIGVSVLNFDMDTDDIAPFAIAMETHYINGLQESGWHGDPQSVSAAARITAALRCLFPAVGWPVAIASDTTGVHIRDTEQRWGRPIEAVFARWSALANYLLKQIASET